MNVVLPKPIRESKDSVTLSRSDWDALIELLEDTEDLVAIAERKSREKALGVAEVRRNYLTGDEIRRLLDWESPLRVWREKRGLSQRALASKAGVSASYLAEIETDQKPGSADALLALARALDVEMESLVSSNRLHLAFGHLKQFIEAGASETEAVKEADAVIAALKDHGVGNLDLAELKEHLRGLAGVYDQASRSREYHALSKIIRRFRA
jgi:transcriptional regulator with XRE-family HTH domain